MYLFVFIKKKLISVDTILPVLLELKTRSPKLKIIIIAPDQKTFDDITKNKTLHSCIEENSKLIQLGGLSKKFLTRVLQKFCWIFQLFFIFLLLKVSKSKVIHFGSLEEWPRSLVAFGNRSKIICFESNGWGTGVFEDKIDAIDVHHVRLPLTSVKSSGALVGFSSNWKLGLLPESQHLSIYSVTPSKLWPAWQDYLNRIAPEQWEKECSCKHLHKDKKVFLFILGTLDALPALDMGEGPIDDLVIDTLDALYLAAPNVPILMKPHVITNTSRLELIIKKAKSKNVHVTYLHPGVIAKYSIAAICNYYSTSLIDLWHSHVSTFEYTKYKKEGLRITGGGSMRPKYVDHFIEIGETKKLVKAITETVNKKSSLISMNRNHASLSPQDLELVNFLLR